MSTGLFEFFTSADAAAVVTLLIRVTLLLAGCALATWALRKRSAAARHFVWSLGLAGSLLLAVGGRFVPRIDLHSARVSSWAHEFAPGSRLDPAPSIGLKLVVPPRAPGRLASERSEAALSPIPDRAAVIRTVVAIVWGMGFCGVLGWYLIGNIGLWRLLRGARVLDEESWRTAFEAECTARGLNPRPRLLESAAVAAPFTWGVLRPVIVVPLLARDWAPSRHIAVLRHELAHVARRDCLVQLFATLTCAIYWFHPVVWMANRRLQNESERACDDRVLVAGSTPADYAADLLQIARSSQALRAQGAVTIGVARRSTLEGRLLAILDERIVRATPPAGIRIAAIGLFAAALVPLAGVRLAAAPAEPTETKTKTKTTTSTSSARNFESTLEAKPGETLTLELEVGGNVEVRGWDRQQVQIRGRLGGKDWEDVRTSATREGNGVMLHTEIERRDGNTSTSCEYEIDVPRKFDVRLRSGGGSVTLTDLEGDFRGATGGGELRISNARGAAKLTTGGGNIHVEDSDLTGTVSTGGGKVRFSNVKGSLVGNTGSGRSVHAGSSGTSESEQYGSNTRHQGKHGEIEISEAGGEIVLDDAPNGATLETGGGNIIIGRAGGVVDVTTGGGDIKVGPSEGSVRATTGGGDVHVILASGDAEQTVEIATGSGKVIVELPSDFDGKFDLETAYTKKFKRETRIDSTWELERSETQDWSSEDGSPRKYVRARGVAGNGRGRIHVRTVNGDITIRRTRG